MAMNRVHRSILLSAIERYGSLLFFLVSTAILSRLLSPHEFGIYAVVNALILVLASAFQEFGGANYLVQKHDLSRLNIRTAFTLTFLFSIVTGTILFMLRDAIASIFAEDGLRLGVAVSVMNFLVWPFSATLSALLRRDLDFSTLTASNLAGNFVMAAASIVLAVLDYSFMAPIWGALAGNMVTAAVLLASRKDAGLFRPSLAGYPDVLRFGAYSSGVVIINVFYNFAPQFFLARVLDFAAAGLYSRAVTITQTFDRLVVQVLNPVIMPAILAEKRSGESLKRIYLDAVELLSAVQWPFLLVFAIMTQPIILIWLGPAWLEVVPLVRILCISYLALFAACLTYPVLVSVGSVRDALVSSLISLPPSLAIMFAASFVGVEAVAAAALLCLPFQAAVAIRFISRHLSIRAVELFAAMRKSVVVTAFSIAGPLAVAALMHAGLLGPLPALLLSGTAAFAGWLSAVVITGHPLLAHVRSVAGSLAVAVRRPVLPAGSAGKQPSQAAAREAVR
jgi:O-antigen/teichoic acid export membrane protein